MSVEKIIAENLNIDIESVKDDSHFVNDLGADSLNIVEVVMGLEEEFDIEIPDEDAETLMTVGQVKQYIEDNA
jgi:acyl carrier protein